MNSGTLALALAAGALSTLSPCVLPLLPLVFGAAAGAHRLGPALLAAGVTLSFVVVGLFVATIGYEIGLDGDVFRLIAALAMIVVGLALAIPAFGVRIAAAAGPLSDRINHAFGGATGDGLAGQFGIGLLLGAVWSPCVGPTLGAASLLAAQGRDLGQVALTMLVFGLGAGLPLLLLGLLSRRTLMALRGRLMSASGAGKMVLGAFLVLIGALIMTGLDRRFESLLVAASPQWLTDLTTRF